MDETFVDLQLRQINRKLVLGQPWYPTTPYSGVKRISAALSKSYGTADKATAKIVGDDGLLQEMVISAVHSCYVVVERPNGKGGHSYPFYSYEHVEYPPGSTAARAVAYNEAQALYPIDDKMGKTKKEKQEALRREYVLDHWQDFYDGMVMGMRDWQERQLRPLPVYHDVRKRFLGSPEKVYRWVLQYEIKWDDKRTVVLNTYDEVEPAIKLAMARHRAFELCNWKLTYEEVIQQRCELPCSTERVR
jgi:hypothetical protein